MRIGIAPRRRDDPMGEEAKYLETARADRSVWLMKCPPVVSRAWEAASASASSSSDAANPNPVVAKVVLSLDPLRDEQPTKASLLPSLLLHPLVSACISVPD